jgi:hypothetical protein
MVCENRALRGISGPKGDEVTGGWGKLHNEELHNMCFLPDIVRVFKSRTVRWVRRADMKAMTEKSDLIRVAEFHGARGSVVG